MIWRKNNKYNARQARVGSEVFDSKKEAQRFLVLKQMEREGTIHNLQRQVKFVLIPAQREPDTIGPRGGVIKGKTIEKECSYVADFVYDTEQGTVVEDVKSPVTRTKDYIIKRKLMLWLNGHRIKEI